MTQGMLTLFCFYPLPLVAGSLLFYSLLLPGDMKFLALRSMKGFSIDVVVLRTRIYFP